MDVTIADDDKLQFYLEEIYGSNHFDKQEMLTWEREPSATKTDFTLAKAHFEAIIKTTDTYEQNAGGGTTGHNRYNSANQMADYDDKIRKYIQQFASASTVKATNTAANIQTKEKLTLMEAEIKKLTTTIALMTSKFNGENIIPIKKSTAAASKTAGTLKGRHSGIWEPTAVCTVFIQLDSTTTAPPATGRSPSTRQKLPGPTDWGVTCIGPQPIG